MKKYLTEAFFKKLGMVVYEDVLKKAAEDYVKKTDNPYDDSALMFLDGMIKDFLSSEADA